MVVVVVVVRRQRGEMGPRLDGRVSLGLEVIVQLGPRTGRGSGEGVYGSFLARAGAARRFLSVGAGRRGCHRLLGEGLRRFTT